MKLAIVILAYDNYKRIEATLDRLYEETDLEGLDFRIHVFSLGYPLPDKETNYRKTFDACRKHCVYLTVMPNFGQNVNIIESADHIKDMGYDLYIPYDCDVRPDKPSWLKDVIKVFNSDPMMGAVMLNTSCTDNSLQNQGADVICDGVKAREVCWPGGFGMTNMRMSFIKDGFRVSHNYYGGTEYCIMEALSERGFKAVMLCDHDDIRYMTDQDAEYNTWKHQVISQHVAPSFEQWLQDNATDVTP